MRANDFKTERFGTVRTDDKTGLSWFDPKPLPRELPLDDETQLALSKADAAVGRLDGIAQFLKNPGLIAGPYAAREALASARIEGTHATLTEVYTSEAGRARRPDEHIAAVESHTHALWTGLEAVKEAPLSLKTLLSVHRALMSSGDHGFATAGQWREEIVYVGAPTDSQETATYVPPPADRLPNLLEEWITWHQDPPRLPLLVRVALLHYQFLTIHPFLDGNGRVARMLTQMLLEEEHALSQPLLYVSSYFANRRREYFDRLQFVRERGEIQQWLQFFLTAVHVQADDGVSRALSLLNLHDEYRDRFAGSRSRAPELVDMLFQNPVMTSSRVQARLGVSNPGALNLIRALEERDVLEPIPVKGPGRARLWIAREILDLIEGGPAGGAVSSS